MNASLPEILAGGFDRYDGTIRFYHRINALLQPDFVVVDSAPAAAGSISMIRLPTGAV
jgi:hypothetical protein